MQAMSKKAVETESEQWVEVGTIEDIPRLGSRVVSSSDGDIAIFRTEDDAIFAVRDQCPHKGGPLSQGIVHGHKVACPLHNWNIHLESGSAVAPDEGFAACFSTRLEGNKIFLCLSAQTNGA